eukprot:SAG11_NODE_11085_length_784_cov_95.560584_1_plen_139_part_00
MIPPGQHSPSIGSEQCHPQGGFCGLRRRTLRMSGAGDDSVFLERHCFGGARALHADEPRAAGPGASAPSRPQRRTKLSYVSCFTAVLTKIACLGTLPMLGYVLVLSVLNYLSNTIADSIVCSYVNLLVLEIPLVSIDL